MTRSRRLRRDMGDSELLLWSKLRAHRLGYHFRRQYPIGPYVLDFYCADAHLCIEVDGEHHHHRVSSDMRRDETLAAMNIVTLRIPSNELFTNFDGVCRRIVTLCRKRTLSIKAPSTDPRLSSKR